MSTLELLEPPVLDGEVLDPEPVHVTALMRPFNFERTRLDVTGTYTIRELLAQVGIRPGTPTLVYLNGVLVPERGYDRVRPKPGTSLLVRVVPRGGNTGGALKIVAGVVLIVVGIVLAVAGYGIGLPLVGVGVSLLISGIINILLPPPTPPRLRALSGQDNTAALSPALAIGGGRNAMRPYGTVPRLIGRHRIFPPYAALPFTEELGSDQYVRLLFTCSLGPCDIEELRIGETPLENFEGVEVEVRTGDAGEAPITLYTTKVFEEPLSIALTFGNGVLRTSQTGASELSVAFAFPNGLVGFTPGGSAFPVNVSFSIKYRRVGQTDFIDAPGSPLTIIDSREGLARGGLRWRPVQQVGSTPGSAWTAFGLGGFNATNVNDLTLTVKAFDANTAAAGSWLRFDSGIGLVNEFGRVLVTSAGTGANCIWSVQYSDDLVDWTTVATDFSTGGAASQAVPWAPAGPHRYWRLLKTNAAVTGPDYYEVDWGRVATGVLTDQYDVLVTRLSGDFTDPLIRGLSFWSSLRTLGPDPAVTLTGLAQVALRIKATDQLSGLVDTFNCIVTSRLLDYASYAGTVLADGPLGYWRLGEIAGAPSAFDASGFSRAGTYQGALVLGNAGLVTGDAATAALFDGTNDAVTGFSGLTNIDMGSMSFTVEVLFTTTSVSGTRTLLSKASGDPFTTGPVGWGLRQNAATIQFVRNPGGGAPTISTTSGSITASTAYHCLVRYDMASGQVTIALNGAVVATTAIGAVVYADLYDLQIGRNTAGSFWSGKIQDAAIYPDVALSAARLADHYAAFQGLREWIVQPTSNPASAYRTVLQDRGNAKAVGDGRLDLPTLEAWHQENASGGRTCNMVVDFKTTVGDLLRDIAACGRATPSTVGTKFSVVRDIPQTVPVQHITPRNSRNFKGQRALRDAVHALKVRFIDPAAGWQQSERIVYDDGYTAANATNFEVFEPVGVTDPDHAWRLGRYHLACMRARPERYEVEMDIGSLACRRGDLVRAAYDVIEWGIAQGRIKVVATSGGSATGVTVDELFPMIAGQNYGLRVQLSDGTSVVVDLVTVPGNQTVLTFAAPLPPPLPAVGDLVMFGIKNLESVPCLVAGIRRGPDFSAILTLVDQAPGVLTADQGTVPPWDPQMTPGGGALIQAMPPKPIIDSVVSDESVLLRDLDGSLSSRILVVLHYASATTTRADYLETRWRRSDSNSPFDTMARMPPDTTRVYVQPVEDGVTYDLRLRTVNNDGPTSDWTEILGHTVVGKTSLPAPAQGLRLENDRLAWDYPNAALDFLGFELRRSAGPIGNWETAFEMHAGVLAGSSFILPTTIFGQWTFLVAAIDTSGNASQPVSITIDFGSAALHNVVESFDYRASGFPGGITSGSVIAGNLVADQVPTGFWTTDGNRFWSPTGTTLFWGGTYKEMTYVFTFTPAAGSVGARIVFDTTIIASAWTMDWKKGALEYAPFPGSIENLAAVMHTFRLTLSAAVVQGQINGLTLYVDADDLTETIANFGITA